VDGTAAPAKTQSVRVDRLEMESDGNSNMHHAENNCVKLAAGLATESWSTHGSMRLATHRDCSAYVPETSRQ